MDFEQYVAARYGRLIEHAVLLGCAEGEAGTYVDKVLLEQRKRIRRSEDPDPLVHEALARAIEGRREPDRRSGPLIFLALVAVAVAVGVALTYRPPPEPLPSLFALDGPRAQRLLEADGYDVVLREARACEPDGLVLGSDPPVGSPVREGATITVRTAVPSGATCDAQYADRSAAWRFLAFALGESGKGEAPTFARTVTVKVDEQDPYRIDQVAAVDRDRWGGVMDRIARVARMVAPTSNGMPRLTVRPGTLPTERCGVPKPEGTGDREVLRLELDDREAGVTTGCPFTVDLYRTGDDDAIDGVVVYTARLD